MFTALVIGSNTLQSQVTVFPIFVMPVDQIFNCQFFTSPNAQVANVFLVLEKNLLLRHGIRSFFLGMMKMF